MMSRGLRWGLPISVGLWIGVILIGRALAGLDVPPAAPDLSGYVAKSEMPGPCPSAPTADTLMGSRGSMNCYVPQDAARPTVVQATNAPVLTDGTRSVTWARPFSSSSPIVLALPVNAGADPAVCNVSSRSAMGAAGRCWAASGVRVNALGAIVNVFAAAPSLSVMVIAREPTQ